MVDKKEKERWRKTASNVVQTLQAQEKVQKFGEASFQFVDGYFGDMTAGRKGLKHIKLQQITDPERNIPQQAGFAAEIYYTSQTNADNILRGNKERVVRTDDVGEVNNPNYDHYTKVDGHTVRRSQMKFRGDESNPELGAKQNLSKLVGDKEYRKYRDADDILVPTEQFPYAKQHACVKAESLRQQAKALRRKGRSDEASKMELMAKRYEDVSERMKGSNITREKTRKLRLNPEKVVMKEPLRLANKAGMKQAKAGAMMAGGFSTVQNLTSVIKGEKSVGAAVVDVAVDTVKGATFSYITTASASLVKAGLKEVGKRAATQSGKEVFAVLSKGNAPALIVTSTFEVYKSVKRYLDGELDAKGLVAELGEKGSGIVASTYGAELGTLIGAGIGSILFPGVGTAIGGVAGGLICSMVGYMVGTQLYHSTLQFLSMPIEAEKVRRAKEMCDQARKIMERERLELERQFEVYFAKRQIELRDHFEAMRGSILANDSEAIVRQLGSIAVMFGGTLRFKNFEEFDAFMLDEDTVFDL
ncbi:hypothetical protein D1872_157130 [compost metagenome]